jgi:ribonuclease BN (tRNA processing enzyme)
MQITCLGCATFDLKQRESFSLLLEDENVRLLIDCGPYIMQGLSAVGRSAGDIDILFLSHTHSDHSGGVAWLLYSRMFERWYGIGGPGEALRMLIPAPSASALDKYLVEQKLASFDHGSAPGFIQYIKPENRVRIGPLSAHCFPVAHTVETFGLRIESEHRVFVFLPDCDVHKSTSLEDAIRGAAVVIAACGGVSERNGVWTQYGFSACRDVAELCARAGVHIVKFFHMFYQGEVAAALAEAHSACPGLNIDILRTGEVVKL